MHNWPLERCQPAGTHDRSRATTGEPPPISARLRSRVPAAYAVIPVPAALSSGGAGAWRRSSCGSGTCPSKGGDEVLRLHVPQAWVSLEDLSGQYRSARRLPRAARNHLGVVSAARRPPHSAQRLKRTAAPYDGETETDVWEGLRSSRSFRSFVRTSPIRVTALRAERRKVAGPPARSPACVCGSTTEVVHSFSTAR
jgi:hypothetical protein